MNVLEIKQLTKFGDLAINLIVSQLRVTKGEIEDLGKSIAKHGKFTKMNIGIVPQEMQSHIGQSCS